AFELFRVRMADQLIENWIAESFNCKIKVNFELSEDADEWNDRVYFMEREREDSILIRNMIQAPNGSTADGQTKDDGKRDTHMVILGKTIQETPVSIQDIREGFDAVTVEGTVFDIEKRAINGNKILFCLDITDHTDSITVKI